MKLYDVYVVTFENDEEKEVEICGSEYAMIKWVKRFFEWAGESFEEEYDSEEKFALEVDNTNALDGEWFFPGARGDIKVEIKIINY